MRTVPGTWYYYSILSTWIDYSMDTWTKIWNISVKSIRYKPQNLCWYTDHFSAPGKYCLPACIPQGRLSNELLWCDDTGMHRTVRSANPRKYFKPWIQLRVTWKPDSTPVWDLNGAHPTRHLPGTQTPRIRIPNQTHNNHNNKHLNTYFIFKALYSPVVSPTLVVEYNIE